MKSDFVDTSILKTIPWLPLFPIAFLFALILTIFPELRTIWKSREHIRHILSEGNPFKIIDIKERQLRVVLDERNNAWDELTQIRTIVNK